MKLEQALTATPEQAREAYAGISDKVAEMLGNAGLSLDNMTTQPYYGGVVYDGTIPENIEQLGYDEISALMRANTEWNRYLLGHLTAVQVEMKITQEQISAVKSSIAKKRGKDCVDSDLRYIQLNVELTTLKCLDMAFTTAIQNAKDAYKILSRLVTIRGQDSERERRNESLDRGYAIRGSNRGR